MNDEFGVHEVAVSKSRDLIEASELRLLKYSKVRLLRVYNVKKRRCYWVPTLVRGRVPSTRTSQ